MKYVSLNERCCILIQILLNCVPKGHHLFGLWLYVLSEPWIDLFTDVDKHHSAPELNLLFSLYNPRYSVALTIALGIISQTMTSDKILEYHTAITSSGPFILKDDITLGQIYLETRQSATLYKQYSLLQSKWNGNLN